jgi:DNA-binding CsgD family transcriptional regulator
MSVLKLIRSSVVLWVCLIIVVLAPLGVGIDLIQDFGQSGHWEHLFLEGLSSLIALAVGVYLMIKNFQQRNDLKRWEAKTDALKQGVSVVINRQFDVWQLSQAQRDIARMIIKGLSFKEIAALRFTQEKTTRTQAAIVYQKSGLQGRHAFSAYFLDALL